MKKLCLLAFALLLCSSLAYAQTVSVSDLKVVLIDSIKDYLSSQTPKLEKAELKDLIVIYLSTKGDTADLSGNGPFSGKKFIDVYNKAKGNPPSASCTSAGGVCKPQACNVYTNCTSLDSTCSSGYCCSGNCENPVPPDAIHLSWGLTSHPFSAGLPGSKTTFVINVKPQEIAYGKVIFICLLPDCTFNFKFTPPPGYSLCGTPTGCCSPCTGGIQYGYVDLMFTTSSYLPRTADGYAPPGNYIFEIEWLTPEERRNYGGILISSISSGKY